MTNQARKALGYAVGVLLLFLLAGSRLPGMLGIETTGRTWILRGGLWLLGVIAAALLYFGLRRRPAAASSSTARDEIDLAIAAARARLAAAKGKAAAKFGRLPVLLVSGPPAAAKTTIVSRSSLQPELLAGEVMRGDVVAPTAGINVWYAQNHLVVEAGGRLADDPAQWRKLVGYLEPNRLGAVLSRGAQAPRLAIVCFGCDELLKPGAAEAVPATAHKLRARLGEAAQQLGIRLPVYVVFTKADRLPYFEDYVRSFTREEARDVLGATLTVPVAGDVGHYAERESRRIAHAFQSVFNGLALRRIDVLPRETQDPVKSGVYEFPREFRKITDLASLFLIELCRPSQLGVSPFLRGFYFTGVRPILVHDVASPVPELQVRVPAGGAAVDATTVFDARALQQQAVRAPVAQTGARKVPEWVFLDRVFRDIVLRDTVAQSVTAGGTKVTLGRRIVLGATAAALAIFSLGMTWSVFANRALLRDTREAVEGARSLARAGALPDLDALERLDRLREQAARLSQYQREDNPSGTGWLLYAGDRVQPNVRTLYFQKFDELLWEPTRARLTDWLSSLPPTPNQGSNYDSTYDALKAYLVTTERPDSARRNFLAPTLLRFWLMSGTVDEQRRKLAEAQFAFFADELPHGNPFNHQVDAAQVQRTRNFLRAFSGEDQLYSYLLALARESMAPIRWQDATVLNAVEVRPEFTRTGWERAQSALGDLPRLLNRETWVAGESAVPEGDRVRIERVLRQKYTTDYASAWVRFLEAGRVPGVSGVREAAARLRTLANTPSPILRMIGTASDHTAAVDTVVVSKTFAAAHTMAAPNSTAPTEAGGKYIQALSAFQVAVDQVANATGSMRDQLQLQASESGRQVRAVVNETSLAFSAQGQAQLVGSAIRALLLAPVTSAEAALGRVSIDELNRGGAGFCSPLRQLGRKYPFDRNAGAEAAAGEVRDLLAPNTGAIWTFYQDNLQNLLTRSGSRFTARQGASPEATPAFRDYFNVLAQVSSGLFSDDRGEFQLLFTLRMETTPSISEINVAMGRSARFTPTDASARPFEWDGTPLTARISARVDNRPVTYVDIPASTWWIFRLLAAGQVEARGADTYRVTWRNGPVPISGELKLVKPSAIFHTGVLSRVAGCPSTIAR